jgi:hypothetical protein
MYVVSCHTSQLHIPHPRVPGFSGQPQCAIYMLHSLYLKIRSPKDLNSMLMEKLLWLVR